MTELFTRHPASVGETYAELQRWAARESVFLQPTVPVHVPLKPMTEMEEWQNNRRWNHSCIHCHNPHDPGIKARAPLPPPQVRAGLSRPPHVAVETEKPWQKRQRLRKRDRDDGWSGFLLGRPDRRSQRQLPCGAFG